MLTVLHTSDWHLGHTLHDRPRVEEHAAFLAWLVELAVAERADALLVAGDLFDGPNPPAASQEQLYDFLVELRARCPGISIVLTGGNHDSAQRLDAPRSLLERLGITMVGGLPRRPDRTLDVDRLLVPLADSAGTVAAWVAAVPFLRLSDLPALEAEDPLIEGVAAVYAEVFAAARARRAPGQAILATGHCYLRDGALSELSERKILGGNQHALPAAIFPDDVAYVALGHLHLAQAVGRPAVRYSGSRSPRCAPRGCPARPTWCACPRRAR
jgi:exonuclease SbcD